VKRLAAAMQHPTSGIPLKDRRRLTVYKDTFLGIEAKEWMENYLDPSDKEHAEEILQTLKDRGVFYNCYRKSAPFRADKEIYAFYSTQEKYQVSEDAFMRSSSLVRMDSSQDIQAWKNSRK